MKPETGIWNTLTRIVIFLIVVAGLIALGLKYLPLIQQNERTGWRRSWRRRRNWPGNYSMRLIC